MPPAVDQPALSVPLAPSSERALRPTSPATTDSPRSAKRAPNQGKPEEIRGSDGTAALDKALDVLDAVGQAPQGLSQAELSERLALPRTTLYRLLGTLVGRGLLRRDPLRRVYCLGFRCFEYARRAYAMPDLAAAAAAELRMLRDLTGETTYLGALDGHEVVALERYDGAHSHRSHSALGERKPLHSTSQGKAILSALPAEHRDALVRDMSLKPVTSRTITDRRRLQAELRLTALRGWSIDDEEMVLGIRCCGAPVIDAQGKVRGSISVAGPAFRLTMERLELLGPEVAEAARRIGAQLSSNEPTLSEGEAQVITGDWAFHGSAPIWSSSQQALIWADNLAPAIHRAKTVVATSETSHHGDEPTYSVALNAPHGLARMIDTMLTRVEQPIHTMVAMGDGVAIHSGNGWLQLTAKGHLTPLAGLTNRRVAAACTDPFGVLWVAVHEGERWRVAELTHDGRWGAGWQIPEPITALAWDALGQTLHLAAPDSGTIYTAQRGQPHLRRLATVPKGSGQLAGLAIDRRGGVWSALRGGWSVVRFRADGSMDHVIALPVPCPTAVGFGGAEGTTLFITSARDAVDRESLDAAPLSGRLFAVHGVEAGVLPAPLPVAL